MVIFLGEILRRGIAGRQGVHFTSWYILSKSCQIVTDYNFNRMAWKCPWEQDYFEKTLGGTGQGYIISYLLKQLTLIFQSPLELPHNQVDIYYSSHIFRFCGSVKCSNTKKQSASSSNFCVDRFKIKVHGFLFSLLVPHLHRFRMMKPHKMCSESIV